MRGVLDEEVKEAYRAHHVPTSNTSNGLLSLETRDQPKEATMPAGREEFRVCPVEEIPEGGGVLGVAGDLEVGVFRQGDQLYAYENRCAHQGGPVCTGDILGKTVQLLDESKRVTAEVFDDSEMHLVCPWHGWEYDLATGELACDRRFRLRRFDVAVKDGVAYVLV